jgi:glycogen synthase
VGAVFPLKAEFFILFDQTPVCLILNCFGHLVQVSDTYSREVAGHGAIAAHSFKFHGIRNGIDPDIWDPYTDKFIPVR